MERLVLRTLLRRPPVDGVGEDVGDRLHEADVLLAEAVRHPRAGPDHAVGPTVALDEDDRGALHALTPLQVGLLEAGLLPPVLHHNGLPGGEGVAGLRAEVRGDPRFADHLLGQALGRDQEKLVLAGEQLQDAAEVDLENAGQDPAGLPGQLIDVSPFDREQSEPRNLTLLVGLPAARLLAQQSRGGGLGELRPLPGLIARLPGAEQRDAGTGEQAEPGERESASDAEGHAEEGDQVRDADRGDCPRRVRHGGKQEGQDQKQHVGAVGSTVETGDRGDQQDVRHRPGDEQELGVAAADDPLERQRSHQRCGQQAQGDCGQDQNAIGPVPLVDGVEGAAQADHDREPDADLDRGEPALDLLLAKLAAPRRRSIP